MANVFNIQHFSLDDGDGIRTVVFFKGCPLDCAWCHNPESKQMSAELSFISERCVACGKCADVCKAGVHRIVGNEHMIDRSACILCGKCADICDCSALKIIGREMSTEEIMAELKKDDIFFGEKGGVTISGGEPFCQPDALISLLDACKSVGYSTVIETSGFTARENILRAVPLTDEFLFDCKETDDERHRKFVGVSRDVILENLSLLDSVGARVILRCPIIPTVNDRSEHLISVAQLANKHKCVKRIELMPYHPLGIAKSTQIGKTCRFSDTNFADKNAIEKLADTARRYTELEIMIN